MRPYLLSFGLFLLTNLNSDPLLLLLRHIQWDHIILRVCNSTVQTFFWFHLIYCIFWHNTPTFPNQHESIQISLLLMKAIILLLCDRTNQLWVFSKILSEFYIHSFYIFNGSDVTSEELRQFLQNQSFKYCFLIEQKTKSTGNYRMFQWFFRKSTNSGSCLSHEVFLKLFLFFLLFD